jgi:AAA+ superfamily predicted ATPase
MPREYDEDRAIPSIRNYLEKQFVKMTKHDLFNGEGSGSGDDSETEKAYTIIRKYGFSKKTLQKTKKLDMKLKMDLHLTNNQYIVLVPFLISDVLRTVEEYLDFFNAPDGLKSNLFPMFMKMYEDGMLSISAESSNVNFAPSQWLLDYKTSGEVQEKPYFSLRQLITDMDAIANCYTHRAQYVRRTSISIIHNLLEKYKEYEYCKLLLDIDKRCVEAPVFYYLVGHMILNNTNVHRMSHVIASFVNTFNNGENIVKCFYDDKNQLFTDKIIDKSIDESGKADSDSVELHSEFKRKYLKDIIHERIHEDVITADKISDKELFFNEENQKQINELRELLKEESFQKIRKRLEESGTRTGFACIFSGKPGSGKTALAYQLAKETGRDIIKVDIASLRSKWWGEDEKNVKGIFSNYRTRLQESRIAPILLFNEADGIFGKRLDVAGNNGAIISSINAVQNIILDELEEFKGILIATTNLTENMDDAFERRFLYKIKFELPKEEVRAKIYKSILKVEEEDAQILAKKYELSGGNIENIYRKKMVDSILYDKEYDLERLLQLAKEEKSAKDSGSKIGFGAD